MHTKLSILISLSLFLTGCSVAIQATSPTATLPPIITATLPASLTPRPSETPLPPPPTPTVVPVEGITSTQLNVRAEPSTASEVLGIIPANQSVQVVGRDPGGNWWQILYAAGTDGKGWVTAQFVTTPNELNVPVVGGGTDSASPGLVIQQLNIRSGPGTNFNALGILNPNDVVNLAGRNRDGAWLQIEFAGGPDGKGWVNAAFIKAHNADSLPIVSDLGAVLGTGTPLNTPLPPPPTIVPAPLDFDSADAPLKTILFDRVGTQTLIYNGDVSVPDGDAEDWIAFTPYEDVIFVTIQCFGNGSLLVHVSGTDSEIKCNEAEKIVAVQAGAVHLVHIQAESTSASMQYVNYTITIKASQ